MYHEVYFMECIGWSNRHTHELFISVVRSPASKYFMSTATVIPPRELYSNFKSAVFIIQLQNIHVHNYQRKAWGFWYITLSMFPQIFGSITVRRNRLGLTNEDSSECQTFENNTLIDENYHHSKVIFCTFHAIWKPFKAIFVLGSLVIIRESYYPI